MAPLEGRHERMKLKRMKVMEELIANNFQQPLLLQEHDICNKSSTKNPYSMFVCVCVRAHMSTML